MRGDLAKFQKQKGRPLLDAFVILFEEFYALSPT
jgi:hypothetical protein